MGNLNNAHRTNWSLAGTSMSVANDAKHGYRMGTIFTAFGAVALYDQRAGEQVAMPYTALSMAMDGRFYQASWKRTFSDRYLKTLANRFAADVAGSRTPQVSQPFREVIND